MNIWPATWAAFDDHGFSKVFENAIRWLSDKAAAPACEPSSQIDSHHPRLCWQSIQHVKLLVREAPFDNINVWPKSIRVDGFREHTGAPLDRPSDEDLISHKTRISRWSAGIWVYQIDVVRALPSSWSEINPPLVPIMDQSTLCPYHGPVRAGCDSVTR